MSQKVSQGVTRVSQGVTKVSPRTLDELFSSGLARTTDFKNRGQRIDLRANVEMYSFFELLN